MANLEQLNLLTTNIGIWNKYRDNNPDIIPDLSRANLSKANLSGANLNRVNLSDSNLIEANLTGANLSQSNLTRVSLMEACLIDANLSQANLTGAYLNGAHLSKANLTKAILTNAYGINSIFSDASLIQDSSKNDKIEKPTERELRQAIARQEFQLYYQPIISVLTGKLAGFEALIRWLHPQKGLVSPLEFIPVAEKTGLIIPIGEWVIEQACQQLVNWQKKHSYTAESLTVSVNVSTRQLQDKHLLQKIENILEKSKLKPQSLKLEITESVLMEDIAHATQTLTYLANRKIQLCIDDFGTGYSSLSYLNKLPVSILKIDKSFISSVDKHGGNHTIIKAIIDLAHSLKMTVIAEGIEENYQLDLLKQFNCEYGQGYYFSKPINKQTAEMFL